MARPWSRLEQSLILLDGYLHPRFGVQDFAASTEEFEGVSEGSAPEGRSWLALHLMTNVSCILPAADLATSDANVKRHLARINAARPAGEKIVLKYFQLLALLYTEHFLHRYFLDRTAFLGDLNAIVSRWNQGIKAAADRFPEFTADDLTKLAYWMATGSGKTLLLHVNLLQFLHYHALARANPLDNILLITPNAGLSDQHLEELAKSGIPAQRFRGAGGVGLDRNTVQVLEITKLSKRGSGPQTVHVDSFEGNNLVFVDEGHRGSSGDVWMGLRDKVAAEGFTFEYSATFGEALNGGNKPEDFAQRQGYGKAIVFDYRYKYFHSDGYGKDFAILNLPKGFQPGYADVLLLGNLLAFYEQLRLYTGLGDALRPYQIELPLLVFIGHTVQAGKKRSELTGEDQASLADVLNMVRFLHRVSTNADGWAVETIGCILSGKAELKDELGRDIFADKLRTLREARLAAADLYQDLMRRVFHAPASAGLILANLRTAPGEIAVRAGNSETYCGVINIGDDANFLKMAEEANLGLAFEADAIRPSLFGVINEARSPVNLLIGAKKFTEGWNSWRVSAMGLLNVGRSEGSEIIQMFGRGVRLKGRNLSLKRSERLPGVHPKDIGLLETLSIFSINGDYLAEFKKMLAREGALEEWEEFPVPLQFNLFDAEKPKLDTIRLPGSLRFDDQPAFPAAALDDPKAYPVIDLRPRVQAITSKPNDAVMVLEKQPRQLTDFISLDLLDWDALYAEMLAWKQARGFCNLLIGRPALRAILEEGRYTLYAASDLLKVGSYADVPRIQEIALTILKQYAERFYHRKRAEWEGKHLVYMPLEKTDENMRPAILADDRPGYIVKVSRGAKAPDGQESLVEAVRALLDAGDALYREDVKSLPNVYFDRNLYQPLLAAGFWTGPEFRRTPQIRTVPVALNEGEARLPLCLREFLRRKPDYLGQRRLYLLRNQSRGRGISFFEADNFYPDFILWIVDGQRQRIVFIDPKGLAMLRDGFENRKVQLYHTLQTIPGLRHPDREVDAFIIADKTFEETQPQFGNSNHTREEFAQHHILFPNNEDFPERLIGPS